MIYLALVSATIASIESDDCALLSQREALVAQREQQSAAREQHSQRTIANLLDQAVAVASSAQASAKSNSTLKGKPRTKHRAIRCSSFHVLYVASLALLA